MTKKKGRQDTTQKKMSRQDARQKNGERRRKTKKIWR